MAHPEKEPQAAADAFIDPEKQVSDATAALDGARAILVERFAEDADLIGSLREQMWSSGRLVSRVRDGKKVAGAKFSDYFDFGEALTKLPSHRILALFRGEKEEVLALSGSENGTLPNRDTCQSLFSVCPGKKSPSKRRREIIVPKSTAPQDVRPIRAETRAKSVASIARGRRWLDEIVAGTVTVEQIAAREQSSIRQVNMTISLAFLAPKLMQAAVEGRLPRGIGVTRLRDAPAEWDRQYAMLGLSV